MTLPPPAEPGMPLAEVDTPALLIDLDAFDDNLARMAKALHGKPARLRAHAKTHKCPAIAHRQIALGAVGQCCQKVSEAEALVQGGVNDVLVSNEAVGARKLRRLAALARQARVAVCADDAGNVADLDEAARGAGVKLRVLVEIDVGNGRCGVDPGAPAVALAKLIAGKPSLAFAGLQSYYGGAQHMKTFAERRAAIDRAIAATRKTRDLLKEAGLGCEIIGGAGTGTYLMEAGSGVYNELQAGSYVFMDGEYAAIEGEGGGPFRDFRHSLFVYTTIMSRTHREWAVCDAGLKAASPDKGWPTVFGRNDAKYVRGSDEHGKLDLVPDSPLKVGDRIRLVPSHCDPTVNLHDWYVCYRGERVEAVWPITARGAVF